MTRALGALPLFCLASSCLAAFSPSDRGTKTANFLKLGAGARAAAMGEAACAVADDATALYWNPAALTRVRRRTASFMHALHLDSSYYDHAAFAQNLGHLGAWGAGAQYFSAGVIPETDDTGTDVGVFRPYDLALSAGYAYTLSGLEFFSDVNGWTAGISGKFVQSKILATASAWATDIGLLSPAYWGERLRLGLSATNLGGRMRFEREPEGLPLALRAGSALTLRPGWIMAADLALPSDGGPYAAVGSEYAWRAGSGVRLAGRAGFNSRAVGGIDGVAGLSFGMGIGAGAFSFDYALVPYGGLGLAHRLSVGVNF